jgi:hypothetical protein
VSDALASCHRGAAGRFGAAWATTERAGARGAAAAAAIRGAISGGAAAADRTAAAGGKIPAVKRSSKDGEPCQGCKDRLGGSGWSNEKRSPKGEDTGSD